MAQRVRAYLGGKGVHRALDAVAGKASGRLFDSVADFGTLKFFQTIIHTSTLFEENHNYVLDLHLQV